MITRVLSCNLNNITVTNEHDSAIGTSHLDSFL